MLGNMKNLGQSFKNWKLFLKTTMKENNSSISDVAC